MSSLTLQQLRKLAIKGVIKPIDYFKAKRLRKITRCLDYDQSSFDLSTFSDRNSKLLFRFTPDEIQRLLKALKIPEEITIGNGNKLPGTEAFCILLRRLAYPNRLSDLCLLFHRDTTVLSRTFNRMINWIYDTHSHRLKELVQAWMTPRTWTEFAEVCNAAGSVYTNTVGFIDGTCRPICRPKRDQKKYYSGYYKEHVIKYQGVMLPNGLIGRVDGAFVGRRHDSAIIHMTSLIREMQQHFVNDDGTWFALYGDSGYANQKIIKVGFKNSARLSDLQRKFNFDMASIRISVEWGFGKLISLFAFLDYKKYQKVLLQDLKKQYYVAELLTNCHTCLSGSQVSQYFDIDPPSLEEYLIA